VRPPAKDGLLFVANFGPDTGYAWDLINGFYARIGRTFAARGWACYACYPQLGGQASQAESGLTRIEFDFSNRGLAQTLRFAALLRRLGIKLIYLTDQPTRSPRYLLFHLAGCRIVVHDHTSGERTTPHGLKRWLKRLAHGVPALCADHVIAVSDYVKNRLINVNCTPARKVTRIYNGLDLNTFQPNGGDPLPAAVTGREAPCHTVLLACRANRYKGVHVALEAAEELVCKRGRRDVVFLYCGDGPELEDFQRMAAEKGLGEAFRFLGKRSDVPELLRSVTLAVAPSLWQEAFGLSVIEAMAAGVPVVASRVGGVPEVVRHGETGLLVEPGDARGLADALAYMLDHPEAAQEMARNARRLIEGHFVIERNVAEIVAVFESVLQAEWPGRPSPTE
jgi:glycosyltransferase involved in cell wall biosynthesis